MNTEAQSTPTLPGEHAVSENHVVRWEIHVERIVGVSGNTYARVRPVEHPAGRYVEYANVAGLVYALSVLATACHEEFGVDDRNEDGEYVFEEDDTVADPDCPITFGMIRRARNELARWTP